jgi:hypothetical protein
LRRHGLPLEGSALRKVIFRTRVGFVSFDCDIPIALQTCLELLLVDLSRDDRKFIYSERVAQLADASNEWVKVTQSQGETSSVAQSHGPQTVEDFLGVPFEAPLRRGTSTTRRDKVANT